MKITKYLTLGLLALSLTPVWGQNNYVPIFPANRQVTATNLTKFSLDFHGGTPYLLVAAIEKATGKPLNVIIPEEDVNVGLPSLKMNNVDVPQLFAALGAASLKEVKRTDPFGNSYRIINTGYGFKTDNNSTLSDDSIWYFHVENPPQDPEHSDKICRYYQLAPYLNSGLSVDDITTAIQTGWKMLGDISPPEINFHKETKLLIAVGGEYQLKVIDDVLKALQQTMPSPIERFSQRLNNVVNRIPQPSGASASQPPGQPTLPPRRLPNAEPPLSPEAQTSLIEAQRAQTDSNNPPPAPAAPDVAPDAAK